MELRQLYGEIDEIPYYFRNENDKLICQFYLRTNEVLRKVNSVGSNAEYIRNNKLTKGSKILVDIYDIDVKIDKQKQQTSFLINIYNVNMTQQEKKLLEYVQTHYTDPLTYFSFVSENKVWVVPVELPSKYIEIDENFDIWINSKMVARYIEKTKDWLSMPVYN